MTTKTGYVLRTHCTPCVHYCAGLRRVAPAVVESQQGWSAGSNSAVTCGTHSGSTADNPSQDSFTCSSASRCLWLFDFPRISVAAFSGFGRMAPVWCNRRGLPAMTARRSGALTGSGRCLRTQLLSIPAPIIAPVPAPTNPYHQHPHSTLTYTGDMPRPTPPYQLLTLLACARPVPGARPHRYLHALLPGARPVVTRTPLTMCKPP